jgi:hypothetical protein
LYFIIISFFIILLLLVLISLIKLKLLIGFQFSNKTLSRFLRRQGYSWKIPNLFQLNKFNLENKKYYTNYISAILEIPPEKLKFFDESHVVEKQLSKRKVLSLVNERVWIGDKSLHSKSFSIFLLVSIVKGKETFFHLNHDNNSGKDVVIFVALQTLNEEIYPLSKYAH